MNAEQLLTHYDRIADAPCAIPRLRRFILDLAVRGKLVPWDPNDEPALELLQRIAEEKARLVRAREIKTQKVLPQLEEEEIPFQLPNGWHWARLGLLASYIQRGKSPKYVISNGLPVISQKCIQWSGLDLSVAKQIDADCLSKYEDVRFLRDGDLLWNSTGTGTIGRLIRLASPPEKLVCDSHVTVVRCLLVDPEYIRTWLRCDEVYGLIEERAAGSTNQVELTAAMALNQPVPLPPLAEQHRIVAKMDELMVLCDRLEAAREEREATRDRLAVASLARLNCSGPDRQALRKHAAQALEILTPLTTRSDQIKLLRQTILNLAVRGKLVPQDPSDEPASELLKRIAAEKAKLINTGQIRKPKRLAAIEPEEPLFDPPRGWVWSRLLEISRRIHYGFTASANRAIDDVRLLRITDIQDNKVEWSSVPGCEIDEKTLPQFKLQKGDVLIARTGGTIGKSFLVRDLPVTAVFASYLIRVCVFCGVYDRYLKLFLESPVYWSQLEDGARGAGQPNVNGQTLGKMLVPLPPLAEQRRIVHKVDELMALSDRLETQLVLARDACGQLLEAVLHEALASAA